MRKSASCPLLAALTLLLPSTIAQAQSVEAGDDHELDDRIVVTANRISVPIERVGQSLTVLTGAQIAASQQIGLTELIAQTPGVQFRRNGGRGTTTSVFLRGADSGQTLVLYDGVRLHDPAATEGGASLADVSTGGIGRIEILRGTQSVLYGSQAIGGVVNIISKAPSRSFEADLQAEAGLLDSYMARAGAGGTSGRLGWRVAAEYSSTDGVSALAAGTERDGYENISVNGKLVYSLSDDLSVDLRSYYADGNAEYDDFDRDAANRSLTKSWLGYAGLNFILFDGLANRLSYGRTLIDRVDVNEADPGIRAEIFDARGRSDRFEYQGTIDLARGNWLVFGVEYAENAFDGSSAVGTAKDDTLGFYGNATLAPFAGLTLNAGLRHEEHSNFGGATVGAASLAYTPDRGDTVLRASYSEGFKAPSLFQLYAPGYGTPDLEAERARSWEVGGERSFGRTFRLSAAYFNRRTANLVSYASCFSTPVSERCAMDPGLFGFYVNEGLVLAQGVELGAGLGFGRFDLSANYTYLDADYATPGDPNFGNQLARRSSDTFNATASYSSAIGIYFATSLIVVGEHFNDAANTTAVPGYATVDIRVSYPLSGRIELYARAENLFSEKYQAVSGYGTLPRMIFGGLRISL